MSGKGDGAGLHQDFRNSQNAKLFSGNFTAQQQHFGEGNLNVGQPAPVQPNQASSASKTMGGQKIAKTPFFTENTVCLMLSGLGETKDQTQRLENNNRKVRELLIDHYNMRDDRVFAVASTGTTRSMLLQNLKRIKDMSAGDINFLFYFIGHNYAQKKAFRLDGNGNRDDFFKYEDLKEELGEVKSNHKLFILDTCYSGGVALRSSEGEVPLLWDTTLGENEAVKIQWHSSRGDEQSWLGEEMGYFTGAIRDVVLNTTCTKTECRSLREKCSPDTVVTVDQLNPCVRGHLSVQTPGYSCSNGEEAVKSFPGFILK